MGAPIRIDRVSGAMIGIGSAHHRIHQGDFFTAFFESDPTDSETIGEETAMGFLTPVEANWGLVHMIFDAWANEESVLEFRAAPTVVLDQETSITAFNRFQPLQGHGSGMSSLETAPTGHISTFDVAEANAANLAGGTILHHETIAIASAAPFSSILNSRSRAEREFVLLPETQYVLIQTCSTNNNTLHQMTLNWYEHKSQSHIP